MTKSELIKLIHDKLDINYSIIDAVVDTMFDEVCNALKTDDKVVISGFGTFEKYYQKGYSGVNPATGDNIEVPGNYKLRFNASKYLKNKINE